jgi:four helix bundle protein
MTTFVFHKLQVWHLAKELAKDIYTLTKRFPAEEKFGLTSQINRAAISIASNIAEGSSRSSLKDQAHFTHLAYGSLMELACQLEISRELCFIEEITWEDVAERIHVIAEKLTALRNSQIKRHKEKR